MIYSSKIGYGKANNLGVKHSTGEYLFFINTDIFIEDGCFEKMLAVLNGGIADCVQPLLIYPQSNLVQCAGTFFGPYFKDHLFDGNRIDADIVNQDGPRQALTSALYAMKRSVFDELNGFDEFYYNKLEGFELSYKIYLSGKLVGIYQVQELGIHVVEAEIYILLISSNRNRTFGVDLAIQLNQIYPSILTNKSINT